MLARLSLALARAVRARRGRPVAGCGTGTVVFTADGGTDASLAGRCHQERIGGTLPLYANLELSGVLPNFTYGGSYSC
jgi:hypothetical protein